MVLFLRKRKERKGKSVEVKSVGLGLTKTRMRLMGGRIQKLMMTGRLECSLRK